MNSIVQIERVTMKWMFLLITLVLIAAASTVAADETISVLLIDGQNDHAWEETTPLIKQTLEGCGRFVVDVATAPSPGRDLSTFDPNFADYDVVVSNYNGEPWSEKTKQAFEDYVAGGGGFVCVHAANNAFPNWKAYNRMIGLGGWGGRTEKDGPYIRWNDDLQRFTRDSSPGLAGVHGREAPFLVTVREVDHPVTRGLPKTFMQTSDELNAGLRGPAENMHVLATAYSARSTGGSGQHEPVLMTIQFGAGRVFHTTLGHHAAAMQGVAFQLTMQRGTEWAATGVVGQPPVDGQTLSGSEPLERDPAAIEPDRFAAIPDIDGDGWVELFNGEDLTGWTQKNGTATYRVEAATIIGKTAEGSPNSFLCTERDYGDFELTFEVNVDEGLNSGVQIRSLSTDEFKNGRVHGPQVEIESSPGESGYLFSEATGRSWITTDRPIVDAHRNGQWNRYVVRARGDRMQTWVNGRPIAEIRDSESSLNGFIALQVHGIEKETGPFEVRWRDLRVREID